MSNMLDAFSAIDPSRTDKALADEEVMVCEHFAAEEVAEELLRAAEFDLFEHVRISFVFSDPFLACLKEIFVIHL